MLFYFSVRSERTCSRVSTEMKPSSISKLFFSRSMCFIAQSNRMYASHLSISHFFAKIMFFAVNCKPADSEKQRANAYAPHLA